VEKRKQKKKTTENLGELGKTCFNGRVIAKSRVFGEIWRGKEGEREGLQNDILSGWGTETWGGVEKKCVRGIEEDLNVTNRGGGIQGVRILVG